MSLGSEQIKNQLEEALITLADTRGEKLARQLRPILLANLDRGRLQTFIENQSVSVSDYVELVAQEYSKLNGLLHSLQVERSEALWESLFERMQNWAYNFFLRKGFTASERTQEIATECATDAAILLLTAYFPYDTDFEPWAHILVQNACRKFIGKALKKSAIPDVNLIDLEDDPVNQQDLRLEIQALHYQNETEIAEALTQLPEARRRVLEYLFFDEMEAEEAARKMGKSVGAIYSLQFRALEDLRKILRKTEDNLSE